MVDFIEIKKVTQALKQVLRKYGSSVYSHQ